MVTCKEFLRELNDYLDPQTDPQARQELEHHVSNCPNCWVVVDTTKKTLQVYKGQEPQEIPPTLHDRLLDALKKKAAERSPSH